MISTSLVRSSEPEKGMRRPSYCKTRHRDLRGRDTFAPSRRFPSRTRTRAADNRKMRPAFLIAQLMAAAVVAFSSVQLASADESSFDLDFGAAGLHELVPQL